MKREDQSQLSVAELTAELEKAEKNLFVTRLNMKIGKEKKTHLHKDAKKQIARLKTYLTKNAS